MRIWWSMGAPLALAAALACAAPAQAAATSEPAAAASPSPEAMRLSVEVAHRIFARVDWQAQLSKKGTLESIGAPFDRLKVRPQWGQFARQALDEEFAAGAPEVDEAMARVFARHLTLDELQAGSELLRGPIGDAFAQGVADSMAGRAITKPTPAQQAAIRASASNPAAVAFVDKIRRLDEVMPEAEQTVGAAAGLGWIRRFYEKAAAAEAPPAAATDEKERLGRQLTQLMFRSVDFGALMQGKLGDDLSRSFDFAPGWSTLMRSAAAEEFGSDRDVLERAGGKVLGHYFTLEELRAGVAVFDGPDGVVFAQVVASGANGGPRPPPDALNHAAMELSRTPAGFAFLKKIESSGTQATTELGEEYGAAAILGVLRRFIDKAEAAQQPI